MPKVIFKWELIAHSWTSEVLLITLGSSTTTTVTVVCPSLVDHVRSMFAILVSSFGFLSLRFHEPFPSFIPVKEAINKGGNKAFVIPFI
jgi:hypothetical protein